MVYLNIDKKIFEKHKDAANKKGIESAGEDGKDDLQFDNLELTYDEGPYYDAEKNSIEFSGQLRIDNDEFAWFSDSVDLDFDMVISIIEAYRKRLGKLKTVLDATK